MKIAFHTLGCKVNQYDTQVMLELLKSAGHEIVDYGQPADVCIINTCTVTHIADKKSRQAVSHARGNHARGQACAEPDVMRKALLRQRPE